jgi:hypothetical protein
MVWEVACKLCGSINSPRPSPPSDADLTSWRGSKPQYELAPEGHERHVQEPTALRAPGQDTTRRPLRTSLESESVMVMARRCGSAYPTITIINPINTPLHSPSHLPYNLPLQPFLSFPPRFRHSRYITRETHLSHMLADRFQALCSLIQRGTECSAG